MNKGIRPKTFKWSKGIRINCSALLKVKETQIKTTSISRQDITKNKKQTKNSTVGKRNLHSLVVGTSTGLAFVGNTDFSQNLEMTHVSKNR